MVDGVGFMACWMGLYEHALSTLNCLKLAFILTRSEAMMPKSYISEADLAN